MVSWLYRKEDSPCIKRPLWTALRTSAPDYPSSVMIWHGLIQCGCGFHNLFFLLLINKHMCTSVLQQLLMVGTSKDCSSRHFQKCTALRSSVLSVFPAASWPTQAAWVYDVSVCQGKSVPLRYVRKVTRRVTRLSSDRWHVTASSSSTLLHTQGNHRLFDYKYNCSL